jgi:chloramphenicol-sensitive protein RarD
MRGDEGAGPSKPLGGIAYGLGAYLAWGVAPLYFKALKSVPATEVLCHRVIWSVAFLGGLVGLTRRWPQALNVFRAPRQLAVLGLTCLLIAGNWLLFIWSINVGRLLEASLGYFINPLLSVLLGVAFMRESLTRLQLVAVLIAAGGVLNLILSVGMFPWISLSLALSFALYGLLRKRAAVDPVVGLFVETLLLLPLAVPFAVYLARQGGAFGTDLTLTTLLVLAGVVTAVPLMWFIEGVRRLRLSTMGLLQYIAPTGQFLLAALLYNEPFTRAHAVTFGCVWTSLGLYTADSLRRQRVSRNLAGRPLSDRPAA